MEKINDYVSQGREEVFRLLKTGLQGLTEAQAAARLVEYGPNIIRGPQKINIFKEFFSHFKNPLVLILLFAAALSAYFGEKTNFAIIAFVVLASVLLNFWEEHSAGQAARKLKDKVSVTATVVRAGRDREIPSSQLTVGDLIFLSAGDLVPADARVIEADDFFVNQSAISGESLPREKTAAADPDRGKGAAELNNIIFSGTNVVSGSARALILAVGQDTVFGQVAKTVSGQEEKSDFEIGIVRFGYLVMKLVLMLVIVLFFLNALINQEILQSFMFALAIAVGVTPELLPVIMSVTLARGSVRMSRKGVIVKRLAAIPNFGSMNILCTDKTGTLTEDKIQLIKYVDIDGQTDEQIFAYTYLNSFFQTGIKNPLDKAVLAYKKDYSGGYRKAEEIPFDFTRRMMSIAVDGPEGRLLITKGAPESVFKICRSYRQGAQERLFTEAVRQRAEKYYQALSADGFRVLALAVKANLPKKEQYAAADEQDMVFYGFVAFLDPPKKDVSRVLAGIAAQGVEIKVITGDNELVASRIAREVGIKIKGVMVSSEMAVLTEEALRVRGRETTIFARFSPAEKNRLIAALRATGAVVGYLGDGINDAPALKTADVGISVNNAVDIAKESADIILTAKSLRALADGIAEGRQSFSNTMKYILMGLSSNFGNMFSVLGAVFFLPFLPMLPIQILLNNLLYDFSQLTIPADNVDAEDIARPRRWNFTQIKKFMFVFAPISSIFDFLTFFLLFFVWRLPAAAFQTGWFMESLATQVLVIHIIRTKKIPFFQSRASIYLTVSTLAAVASGWFLPYTALGRLFSLTPLRPGVLFSLAAVVIVYLFGAEITKRIFYRFQNRAET